MFYAINMSSFRPQVHVFRSEKQRDKFVQGTRGAVAVGADHHLVRAAYQEHAFGICEIKYHY